MLDSSSAPAAGALGSAENPINYSWRIDYQYTFANLLNYQTTTSTTTVGSDNYYVPVSIPALNNDGGTDTTSADYAKYNPDNGTAVTPTVTLANGVVTSNFYITSIKNASGTEVFTEVKQHRGDGLTSEEHYRPDHTSGMTVTLSKTDYSGLGLAEGGTFYVQVSNGDWYQLTYSAAGTSIGTKVQ